MYKASLIFGTWMFFKIRCKKILNRKMLERPNMCYIFFLKKNIGFKDIKYDNLVCHLHYIYITFVYLYLHLQMDGAPSHFFERNFFFFKNSR